MDRLSLIKWPGTGGGGGVTSFNTRTGAVTLLGSDVITALGYTPLSGANDGLSVLGTIVKLGQTVGQVGNPANLLEDRELPFNNFTFAFSDIGNIPTSFLAIKVGAGYNHISPIVQFQDSAGGELATLKIADNTSIFFGAGAATSNTGVPGQRTVAIGTNVLAGCLISYENVVIGFNAMANNSGNGLQNTAIGSGALQGNISGNGNQAIGTGALSDNTTGNRNHAVGSGALSANTTGSDNTAVGDGVLAAAGVSSVGNTAIGSGAASQAFSGSYNTIIGYFASLDTVIANNNILIGYQAQAGAIAGDISNTTVIGVLTGTVLSNVALFGTSTQNILLGFTNPATDNGSRVQVNGTLSLSVLPSTGNPTTPVSWDTVTNKLVAGPSGSTGVFAAGQTTLAAGTKAIAIPGLTTASKGYITLVTPIAAAATVTYQAVCTSGTLTIQANIAAGTIDASNTSILNYLIIL